MQCCMLYLISFKSISCDLPGSLGAGTMFHHFSVFHTITQQDTDFAFCTLIESVSLAKSSKFVNYF